MKGFKKLISLSMVLMLATFLGACSDKTDNSAKDLIKQEGVLVVVNGKTITQEEFDENLAAYKKMVETRYGEGAWDMEISPGKTIGSMYSDESIIDNMILERLLMDAAEKDGITMPESELENEVNQYKSYFDNDEGYQEFLKSNAWTEEYLKEAIKKDYVINHYIEKNIETLTPSDDELKKLFDEVKMGQEVKASHILVETEDEAKKVLERLKNGEKFEDVAKEVSIDTASGAEGGDVGSFPYTGKMVKEFSDAAFAMNVGDISDPVKSEFGYHVIKVTDKTTDSTVTLESSKDSLTETYKNKKYEELIENLKKNAEIIRK